MTDDITMLISEISEEIGRLSVLQEGHITPHLRRKNRIRTIHSSLAIENNTLTLDQVTAIIDGKRVLGNPNEIREVRNAYEAYELMLELDPLSVDDLLKAHGLMMAGLIPENGRFRAKGVGVFDGEKIIHMAPPAELVPGQINDLIEWYSMSSLHPLIKWKELFYWLPIEELIQSRQKEYYEAFNLANNVSDSSCFVTLMLEIIRDTLRNTDQVSDQVTDQVDSSVQRLLSVLGDETLSAAEIMKRLGFSHRPSFKKNYLDPALEAHLIERTIPDKPNSSKQRYRKVY